MMSARKPLVAALILLVGLLLLLNGQWLFPKEGDDLHRYERTTVTVENGTLSYESPMRRPAPGELRAVDCQPYDRFGRNCALDRYLAANGNLTVTVADGERPRASERRYTRVGGTYYRRTVARNGTRATYGLERTTARELRAAIADELPGTAEHEPDDPISEPVGFEAAVTGEPVVSPDPPGALRLGRVYARNGSYYAVVQTDEWVRDRPLVSAASRTLLSLVGVALLTLGVLLAVPDG